LISYNVQLIEKKSLAGGPSSRTFSVTRSE